MPRSWRTADVPKGAVRLTLPRPLPAPGPVRPRWCAPRPWPAAACLLAEARAGIWRSTQWRGGSRGSGPSGLGRVEVHFSSLRDQWRAQAALGVTIQAPEGWWAGPRRTLL